MTTRRNIHQAVNRKLRLTILARDHYRCKKCGFKPPHGHEDMLHIDHIRPVARGGNNHPNNLQVLCSTCNYRKSDTYHHGGYNMSCIHVIKYWVYIIVFCLLLWFFISQGAR